MMLLGFAGFDFIGYRRKSIELELGSRLRGAAKPNMFLLPGDSAARPSQR